MLSGIQRKLLFPVPEPSYCEDHPLRDYTIDGWFAHIPGGKMSYLDFKAKLLWAADTPCDYLLSHCLTVSLYHCLTVSLSHCLTASLSHCPQLSINPS